MKSKSKSDGTPFNQMTGQQKTMFVVKVIVCVISFGMVFPNVMDS